MEKKSFCVLLAVFVVLLSCNLGAAKISTRKIYDRLIEAESLLSAKLDNVTELIKQIGLDPVCPRPVPCPTKCQDGEVCIDLDQTGIITGQIAGFSVVSNVTGLFGGKPCSRQGVFKIHFVPDMISPVDDVCLDDRKVAIPFPSQKLLKIQMYYSNGERSGWTFNIGDSITNDGYAGDGGTQSYDAEAQGLGNNINVYASDKCNATNLYNHANALSPPMSLVNAYVKNYFLRVTNDNGLLDSKCDSCLFGLQGQADTNPNSDIYFAGNRVVAHNSRSGVGLCFVKMRWVTGINQ